MKTKTKKYISRNKNKNKMSKKSKGHSSIKAAKLSKKFNSSINSSINRPRNRTRTRTINRTINRTRNRTRTNKYSRVDNPLDLKLYECPIFSTHNSFILGTTVSDKFIFDQINGCTQYPVCLEIDLQKPSKSTNCKIGHRGSQAHTPVKYDRPEIYIVKYIMDQYDRLKIENTFIYPLILTFDIGKVFRGVTIKETVECYQVISKIYDAFKVYYSNQLFDSYNNKPLKECGGKILLRLKKKQHEYITSLKSSTNKYKSPKMNFMDFLNNNHSITFNDFLTEQNENDDYDETNFSINNHIYIPYITADTVRYNKYRKSKNNKDYNKIIRLYPNPFTLTKNQKSIANKMTTDLKKLFGTNSDKNEFNKINKFNQINMMAFNYHDVKHIVRDKIKQEFIKFYATKTQSSKKTLRK